MDLLSRQTSRWPQITARISPTDMLCYCIAPPPVFSLDLARTQSRTLTLFLGQDIVARASIANFEQLRIDVLASGYHNAQLDPNLRSAAVEKGSALSPLEAGVLALLASTAGQEGLNMLHHLYVKPTVC
jgi:hypothetical protein